MSSEQCGTSGDRCGPGTGGVVRAGLVALAAVALSGLVGCTKTTDLEDQPPTVTISQPASGTEVSVGEAVTFTATATDVEDGDLTASIVWTSSADGALGTGGSISTTLSVVTHTITATVTDSDGASATDGVTVTVLANQPPSVTITAPAMDTTVQAGESVTLVGSAADAEDGDLTASIVWSSDLDGALGTGGSLTETLSTGAHVVEARVTDSDGEVATDTVAVEVTATTPLTVTDMVAVATSETAVTLTWTEVDDGTGAPAGYEVRFARNPIGSADGDLPMAGSCSAVLSGTAVGATVQCNVDGLRFGTTYDFVVRAQRAVAGGSPLRGARSTPAPATTDFVEDFSAFADGEVPSEPHDGYDYGTSDGLNDVTVRVAATSGGLTDRPLVLGKAGSVLAGSSNFSIARPTVVPLVEADRGVIRLSMDVQVNSGGFCAFFTVRNAASTPVSVSLHNLSYTVGVPFAMVMIMDVDAGTISATQDGVPVAVSRTNFPYLPTRFAVESCTLGAQESALDNVRIEHRTP